MQEFIREPGYDAVFILPNNSFGINHQAWDIVMYDTEAYEEIAVLQWRKEEE